MPRRRNDLETLLHKLYSSEEALRVTLRRLSQGEEVLLAVRTGLSFAGFVSDLVTVLEQRAAVDSALFAALAAEFTARKREIERTARTYGIAIAAQPETAAKDDETPLASPEDRGDDPAHRLFADATMLPALSPTQFFELQGRVGELLHRVEDLGRASGVDSVKLLVAGVKRDLKVTEYTVAVVGPQRVGKSTLVNALLGENISPVADFPTTAVPLLFTPGDKPSATILFEDGTRQPAVPTAGGLRAYAAQQENDGNEKLIQAIHIQLPNSTLARGMALVDLPGLLDASPTVQNVTRNALDRADAVLYVLDASLDRKFAINAPIQSDLRQLSRAKERVLLVLNQADALPSEREAPMLAYVEKELQRSGVWGALAMAPLLVSGRDAWECRQGGTAVPERFVALEEALWGHLLKHKLTGLHRLGQAVRVLQGTASECAALLSARSENGAKATDVSGARERWRTALNTIKVAVKTWQASAEAEVVELVDRQVRGLCRGFDSEIDRSTASQFPAAQAVTSRLRHDFTALAQQVGLVVDERVGALSVSVAEIAGQLLHQSSALLGLSDGVGASLPFLSSMAEFSVAGIGPEMGFFGALAGIFGGPVAALFGVVIGTLLGEDIKRKRVERKRKQLKEAFSEHAADAQRRLLAYFRDQIRIRSTVLAKEADVRLTTFIEDAERRLERLGKPLTEQEAALLDRLSAAIVALQIDLQVVDAEIQPILLTMR
jgi:GTPase SAR1 family protein